MLKKVELHSEKSFTFSSYVVAGDFIYTAHVGGIYDSDGNKLKTIEGQTAQTLRNLDAILGKEGANLNDIVKITVWMKNLTLPEFKKMKDVYREYFTDGYPARMSASTDFLEPDCLIMMEAVAYKPTEGR